MPPFRELAPHPTVWDSRTATLAPRFASVLAADNPVKPAPITATSTRSGEGCCGSAGISAVYNQNVFSRMGIGLRARWNRPTLLQIAQHQKWRPHVRLVRLRVQNKTRIRGERPASLLGHLTCAFALGRKFFAGHSELARHRVAPGADIRHLRSHRFRPWRAWPGCGDAHDAAAFPRGMRGDAANQPAAE